MKKPTFFIIGAPKCGTTSLAAWLADHPDIFMSPTKEPHYFNTDHKRYLNSLAGYEQLFGDATDRHSAVGEASVWYLYSANAVENIQTYNPDAKFIVMLRNPIEMAPSLHEELVFTGREDVDDFATAWQLQDARRSGERLPHMAWEPSYLQYGAACSLGALLDRLYQRVPADRVKTIVLDDVRSDPRGAYLSALSFLGVPDDGRVEFNALNQAKARRWPSLLLLPWMATQIKHVLGIEGGLGLWRRLDALNKVDRRRAPIDPKMKVRLHDYFVADIRRLETLIGRDLSHWLA
jgi:sulfotransferase family protein